MADARRRADEAVTAAVGSGMAAALTTRARVANAQGEPEQAECDAREALAAAAAVDAHLFTPDALECLAELPVTPAVTVKQRDFTAQPIAVRQDTGIARFKTNDDGLYGRGRRSP